MVFFFLFLILNINQQKIHKSKQKCLSLTKFSTPFTTYQVLLKLNSRKISKFNFHANLLQIHLNKI